MSPHKLGIKVPSFDKDDYCNDNLDIVVRRRSTRDLWGESLYNKTGIQIMVDMGMGALQYSINNFAKGVDK